MCVDDWYDSRKYVDVEGGWCWWWEGTGRWVWMKYVDGVDVNEVCERVCVAVWILTHERFSLTEMTAPHTFWIQLKRIWYVRDRNQREKMLDIWMKMEKKYNAMLTDRCTYETCGGQIPPPLTSLLISVIALTNDNNVLLGVSGGVVFSDSVGCCASGCSMFSCILFCP